MTYDYHFPKEDEKIPCLCGSAKCKGTLYAGFHPICVLSLTRDTLCLQQLIPLRLGGARMSEDTRLLLCIASCIDATR